MNIKSLIKYYVGLTLFFLLLLTACNPTQPTITPIPPTPTLAQPTTPASLLPPTVAVTLVPPTSTPAEANPSPRSYTSLAYDSESKRVIMFSGQTGDYEDLSSYNDETWAYDAGANKWTEMEPSSGPTKRSGHASAYDTESDRVILYGGGLPPNWSGYATWAYDFNSDTWTKMAYGPANHLGARLAYDAESDRIILFGGYVVQTGVYKNDTWAYDFNSDTWTEMKPKTSPPGRNYHAMTYDTKIDRVLVWGDNSDGPVDKSMWSYDFNTNTWKEIKQGKKVYPAGRDYPVMAYDAESDRTILYGGVLFDGDEIGDETWAYDANTNTWTKMKPSTVPGLLSRHAIEYDSDTDRILIFGGWKDPGGINCSNETWSYDFNTDSWTNETPKP